jgi:hypothetical protein
MTAHLPPESAADHLRNALAILTSAVQPHYRRADAVTFDGPDYTRALELLRTALALVERAAGAVSAAISRDCPACGVTTQRPYESRNVCPRCDHVDRFDAEGDDDPRMTEPPHFEDREPPPPPDYGPPGSGAVIIEYTGNEPGLEDSWDNIDGPSHLDGAR